ncbi:hypothetical protein M0R19_05635 [Candidatus Pacearchaeota archaeon]|jgi:hypothetical protein|nr:hypothetical protein [Candidatus Pacearchaeota archaeon]
MWKEWTDKNGRRMLTTNHGTFPVANQPPNENEVGTFDKVQGWLGACPCCNGFIGKDFEEHDNGCEYRQKYGYGNREKTLRK